MHYSHRQSPPKSAEASLCSQEMVTSRLGLLIDTLQTHVLQLYNEGKYPSFEKETDSGNLLSSMIAATENGRQEANQEMKSMKNELLQPRQEGLSMSSMFGNVFVYDFAGHDTTAAVFAYAILLLAANKDCQDWIAEKLQHVLVPGNGKTWEYNQAFPQLKRCLERCLHSYSHMSSLAENRIPWQSPSCSTSFNKVEWITLVSSAYELDCSSPASSCPLG